MTVKRFFIHDMKHQPGLAMYLLKEGGGLDGVQQSLAFGGWTRLCCEFPFQVPVAGGTCESHATHLIRPTRLHNR
jgi:hypothetical protein